VSDIFISYASADRARVRPLVDALTKEGWSVWWDRTIPPGKTWDQVIEAALDDARCVILLWSRDSVQSEWVRTEADEARQRGILVPALLDAVRVPLAFRQIHAANLVDWAGVSPHAEFDLLVSAVSDVLSRSAQGPDRARPISVPARASMPRAGPSVRAALMFGAPLLAALAGLVWYFAPGSRHSSLDRNAQIMPANVAAETVRNAPAASGSAELTARLAAFTGKWTYHNDAAGMPIGSRKGFGKKQTLTQWYEKDVELNLDAMGIGTLHYAIEPGSFDVKPLDITFRLRSWDGQKFLGTWSVDSGATGSIFIYPINGRVQVGWAVNTDLNKEFLFTYGAATLGRP
jgi:hypothetical protein